MLRKLILPCSMLLWIAALVTACGGPMAAASPTSQNGLVSTIVAGTMDALLSATPVPSSTSIPTDTPAATATLVMPQEWVVYTNEQYGFQFAHPNLYDCKDQCGITTFLSPNVYSVVNLAVESTLSAGPFDGLSIVVFTNPDAIPLPEIVEQEKQAMLAGPTFIGPPLDITPYIAGGQTGISMSFAGNISRAIYIPLANSNKILIFSIGNQHEGSFEETADQILSTLRFTK